MLKKQNNDKSRSAFGFLKSREIGIVVVFFVICILLAIMAPQFVKLSNLTNIARQMAVIAIISVGMTFVIVTGGIDLSVGSTVAFTGCITALLLVKGYPIVICILIGVGLGTLVGLINGLLIVYVKLAPFIATLGTMSIARGLVLALTKGYPIQPFPKEFEMIGRSFIGIIPVPVLIMAVIGILGHIFLSRTRIGRYIYYIGSNEIAARLSGLNVNSILTLVYTIAGFLSGLASVVLISRLTSAQSNMGSGFELDAIAAVVIGGTSLSGGEGTVLGSLVGAALMGVIKNALILLGVNVYWQSVVIGVVIVLAVSIDAVRKNNFHLSIKEFLRIEKQAVGSSRKKAKKLALIFLIIICVLGLGIYSLRSRFFKVEGSETEEGAAVSIPIAPTTMPVTIKPESQFGIGELIEVCDTELMVISVKVNEQTEKDLVIVDLEITNNSESQVPINSFDFTVVDRQGKVHTDMAIGKTEFPLGNHRLDPGNSAGGEVAFLVPKEDREVVLIWQPGWCVGVAYIDLFE